MTLSERQEKDGGPNNSCSRKTETPPKDGFFWLGSGRPRETAYAFSKPSDQATQQRQQGRGAACIDSFDSESLQRVLFDMLGKNAGGVVHDLHGEASAVLVAGPPVRPFRLPGDDTGLFPVGSAQSVLLRLQWPRSGEGSPSVRAAVLAAASVPGAGDSQGAASSREYSPTSGKSWRENLASSQLAASALTVRPLLTSGAYEDLCGLKADSKKDISRMSKKELCDDFPRRLLYQAATMYSSDVIFGWLVKKAAQQGPSVQEDNPIHAFRLSKLKVANEAREKVSTYAALFTVLSADDLVEVKLKASGGRVKAPGG
jgi:hypothetical protein